MGSPLYLTLLIGPVEAVPAPKPVMDALTSVEVSVSAKGASGFQLNFTLANSSPLQTLFLLAGGAPLPVIRVILVATFGGLPQVVMDGVVKHTEVVPDAMRGSSTLAVTGEDLTAVMDLIPFSGLPYPSMTPDMRVLTILAKYSMFGIVPNVFPVVTPDVELPVEKIPTHKGTDLDYIRQLAIDAGYVFYLEPGPLPGMTQAYWGPEIKVGVPQPALNVNMDAWTNVESLNLRYEPQSSVTPFVFIQDPTTKVVLPMPIPPVTPLNPPLGMVVPTPQKFEYLTDTAKLSPAQAIMVGMARASETADVVSADGSLDVLRYGQVLRARQLVGVRGAGVAFDGLYYVESARHQIKPGAYKQSFSLKRNALVSNLPVVPTMAI
ncbi:MAG TPA: hypothetical protein VFL79_19375 [Terriglobia bacterium]|nr:hypothetical protein [Terriglobia bacterium]